MRLVLLLAALLWAGPSAARAAASAAAPKAAAVLWTAAGLPALDGPAWAGIQGNNAAGVYAGSLLLERLKQPEFQARLADALAPHGDPAALRGALEALARRQTDAGAARAAQAARLVETVLPATALAGAAADLTALQNALLDLGQEAEPLLALSALERAFTGSYLKTVDGRSVGVTRIESLFGKPVEVLDVSDYVRETRAVSAPELNVFQIGDVFAERKAYLGFGKPNVYLALPAGEGVSKFDAKSIKRADSRFVPTLGRAQSGIMVVFKNLGENALARLLENAKLREGTRDWTCVNANCKVLAASGFTVGGVPLERFFFPMPLLKAILEQGLELDGVPVEFDLVRTTPSYLEEYKSLVNRAVTWTLLRHAKRGYAAKTPKKAGPVAPDAVKKKPLEAAPVRFPPRVSETRGYDVDVSRPSRVGRFLRALWGPHQLFRMRQTKVSIDEFLPSRMRAFPQQNPSFVTRLKKHVLFSRPVVWLLKRNLAASYETFGDRSDREIFEMMRAHSPRQPNTYNLVLEKGAMSLMHIEGRSRIADWILSKHVLMSGYSDDVRFAGEIWKGIDGRVYVSNNSGTYRPSLARLKAVVDYLRAVFPNLEFVAVDAAADPFDKPLDAGTLGKLTGAALTEVAEGVYHLNFPTQHLLASTFLRFQEHYESPLYAGKAFTLEEFMDRYAADRGRFSYFEDWSGFNIPSRVLDAFKRGEFDPLTRKEAALLELFKDKTGRFYLIGTNGADPETLRHEIAHGLFYRDDDYRARARAILSTVDAAPIQALLTSLGYGAGVLEDETHAYLGDDLDYLKANGIAIEPYKKAHEALLALYRERSGRPR